MYARLRPIRSPILLPIRMNAAETERLERDRRLHAARRRVEVVHDRRDRHVHQRRVDDEHEHRHREQDREELVAARLLVQPSRDFHPVRIIWPDTSASSRAGDRGASSSQSTLT